MRQEGQIKVVCLCVCQCGYVSVCVSGCESGLCAEAFAVCCGNSSGCGQETWMASVHMSLLLGASSRQLKVHRIVSSFNIYLWNTYYEAEALLGLWPDPECQALLESGS